PVWSLSADTPGLGVARTVSAARSGEGQSGRADGGPAAGNGASRIRRQDSSPARARIVTASPLRLARRVTSRPAQGTGADDQSDTPRETTAPSRSSPSQYSAPALIQVVSSRRRRTPAWSNWWSKSATNDTSTAASAPSGDSRAWPPSRSYP